VDSDELKSDLLRYLRVSREALIWKLDGLSEYDVRRPLVRTGTNLLGLVKHVASVEAWYLGDVFGRPFGEPLPWLDEGADSGDILWQRPFPIGAEDDAATLYERIVQLGRVAIRELLPALEAGSAPRLPQDDALATYRR